MAIVTANVRFAPDIYLMKAETQRPAGTLGRMGQFYMLRGWRDYPVLARPVSIHDIEDSVITFLYRIHGEGTRLLAELRPGDQLQLEGPFGNGFPELTGRTALVGGGMGIAPLLLAAKRLPSAHAYLGFTKESFGIQPFIQTAAQCTVSVSGTILTRFHPDNYDVILACGPAPMLRALRDQTHGTTAQLFVSIERRMACGIGACYVCAVPSPIDGTNRKACKDGPVFAAEEVDWNALDCL